MRLFFKVSPYQEHAYEPCDPTPDTFELAKGERLMLYHDRLRGPMIFWQPAGEMRAGWVIGIGEMQ